MTRDEKIERLKKIGSRFFKDHIKECSDDFVEAILKEIDPPEIEVGMWGKFWDDHSNTVAYGELVDTEREFYFLGDKDFLYFEPVFGLKEAIEKLEKE